MSFILDRIGDNIILKTNISLIENDVENMEFLEAQSELLSSRVYVARPEEARRLIPGIRKIEKNTALITGGSAEAPVLEELREICTEREMALICTKLSPYAVGNIISGILLQYQKQAQRFLEASCSRRDLQKYISIAAELSGCPVFMLSPSFHVIKCAGDCGKWSEKLIKADILTREDIVSRLSAEGAYYHSFEDKQGRHLHFYSIAHEGNALAYLLMIDESGGALDYEYILKQTADNIRFLITIVKQYDTGQSSDFALLLHDIIEQKIMTAPEIFERLEALPYPIKQRRRIAVVTFDDKNLIPYDFILAQLRDVFPDYNMAFFRGEIVILICEDERIFNVEIDEKRINEILAPYDGYMCVGHSTSDITKIRTQYLLTRHALVVAKKLRHKTDLKTRVFHYGQYATYVLIDMFAHRFQEIHGNNDILYLGHPAVVKISRYDRQHNNNLRDVLYAYLMNDRNLVRTAEVMHMHRNTVFYKINQIKELIGLDLEDGRLQQDFLLSCQIISYYEDYLGETLRL
ncbi:MAG TPA: PucR family transcriptional regulator [Clostridiales bacterium]|nr:PucR family transcriptional regulator [Clostridiales bacterium]